MADSSRLWKIGTGLKVITPPLGSQMAGFDARKGVSTSVHDDLHARALVLDDGEIRTALVSVEVIAVPAEFTAKVRLRVEHETGIPAHHVFLSATHTHCGPVTLNHFFNQGQPLDEQYLATLSDGIVASVHEASLAKKQRTLSTGMFPCEGIAKNRRTEDSLPVDPYAGLLVAKEPDGKIAAVAVFYACHTTVLGPDTLSITQDFPYYTLASLKQSLGEEVAVMYFNGAEGDLSIGHKSDLSAVGIIDSFRTFATAQRLGETLADAVLSALPNLTQEPAELAVSNRRIALPLKRYKALKEMTHVREHALAHLSTNPAGTELLAAKQRYLFARIEEYYAKLYEELDVPEPKHLTVDCSAIRIGDTALLTLPGEVFVRIALAIRYASPFPRALFLGLTNDYIGYVPDEYASAASGYEVIASRVPWHAGVLLQQAAAELFEEVRAAGKAAIQ